MNLDKVYQQHEKEMRESKDKVQRLIVRRKYFKTKSPNFLTYNEKEQIKTLHNEEPDKWTIEKLSESFPADPYAISLIVRSKWMPKDTNRIFKHDESVRRNWQEYKEGKLDVDPMLAEHLKKFAFRDFNKLAERPPNKRLGAELPKPKSNEFSSIISSCSKYAQPNEELKQIESSELRIPKSKPQDDDNSFMLLGKKKYSSKEVTLSELQQVNPEIDSKVRFNEISRANSNMPNLRHDALKEDNFISLTKNDEKVRESLNIQERIKIPRDRWQKGKIYKVDDCFYADDGEFLYRVPGFK